MTFLDLFRARPEARKPRVVSGTQPGQEAEIQRHRGRRTSAAVPRQRRKDRSATRLRRRPSPRTTRAARSTRRTSRTSSRKPSRARSR
ncbi:MAG: hypothetical protein LC620_01415 [Halobacteriales archaeon]|nr:hypothetical protein [Halobacteriales archaeon]